MNNALQFLMGWPLYAVPAFLFLITVVVFFHELGHFLMARACGVRIETFSIGFGRGIVRWHDRHGTQWKIGWLPLGGFVKFYGDADGASTPDREAAARMSPAERKVAFPFKPLWQRALIVVAGPAANFILAVVVLTCLFALHGMVVIPPVVGDVAPHSAGAQAGLRTGDRIVAVDGTQIDSYADMAEIVSLSAGQTLPITIDRGRSRLTLWAVPKETAITDPFGNRQRAGDLGISPPAPPVIDSVDSGKPGSRAGLRGGDRIVALNGHAVTNFEEVQRVVSASAGKPVTIGFLRGHSRLDTQATPFRNADGRGLLGIAFAVPRTVVHLDPVAALGAAVEQVRQIVATTFRALFHSSAGLKQVSGIIGIAKVSGQVAQVSFVALLDLVAQLSVSIGLVNLFPIPLLDGGHLLYYACEGVLGRPLGERAQDVGFRLGLAVVAGIFLLATWNDLLNLF